MTTYINIFGGPGIGKSTLAAGIFSEMKRQGKSVELVTEFAKDLVWENRRDTLAVQPYVSMKQFRNLFRLQGKVDYVVTDSPLLKDSVYAHRFTPDLPQAYHDLLGHLHTSLGDHINIFLTRSHAYDKVGRYQSEDEAIKIDEEIRDTLDKYSEKYIECPAKFAVVMEVINGL